jgi:chromosome segregation protein
LQQAAQARQGGAVSGWIERHGLKNAQRLSSQLKVESGWETAVETVLGDQLQALCVDDLARAPQWLADFTKGAVNLFEAAAAVAASGGALPSLASKISGPAGVAGLVGGIYVAEDLATALAARKTLAAHESVITRDGLWLGANWLRVAKEVDANSGVLARAQELETLAEEIDELDVRVTELGAQLNAARNDVRAHELNREALQRTSSETSRKHGELRSQHSARQARIEQMIARRENTQREIDEAKIQFQQEQENMAEARAILAEAIEAMEQDADMREALLKERDDNRARLDAARQRARHDKDHAHQLAMRHQNLKTQIDSIAQSLSRTRSQVDQLLARRNQLELAIAENSDPLDGLKGELESMLEKRVKVEQELGEARRALEAVDHELRSCEKRRSQILQETQMYRSQLEHARLDSQTLQERRKMLQEQLAEAEFNLEEVLAGMPEGANQQEWSQTLEQIAARIARLGPINLAAIDEYKVQGERKEYLDRQNADLAEALETLESAIRKIDRETRSRFKDTFDQINAGVQDLFPKVFGGGRAYLEMTGDDLLDTGIAIMAQPPGKRNSTIHLLSGGEKALTAIALVFSIFKLNPAPFCMLDEVDAPLDDANVGRYARMVKEMSSQVQFIYITHNKIAMEMADQLLGVTMHEPGVSRLVTVDVQEAAELAAS